MPSSFSSIFAADGAKLTSFAPYIFVAIAVTLSLRPISSGYVIMNSFCSFSIALSTFSANSIPPFPPSAHTLASANSHPIASTCSLMKACSASVSVINELSVTTTLRPNFCIFSICLSRLTIPFLSASRFSSARLSFLTPPLYLRAFTVATITTASGLKPVFLHLMSRNFSAPRSAPNPASVTT